MEKRLFTSESVTEGHPDKICDAISDAILDALLAQDPMSRVACETCTTTGYVMVMGEITSTEALPEQKNRHFRLLPTPMPDLYPVVFLSLCRLLWFLYLSNRRTAFRW